MIVIDNFLTDENAVRSIQNSPFWQDPSFYWRKMDFDGWKDINQKDSSIGSYIVERMLQESKLLEEFPFYSALGYEYWPTVLGPESERDEGEDGDYYSLAIHADYDVVKAVETGEMAFPMFGAIMYFGNEDVEGGLLKIWRNENEYAVIEPKHNRLVVFESHNPHGVTAVTAGVRKSIAINFWKEPIMLEEGKLA